MLTSAEMRENVDVLENEHKAIQDALTSLQQRLQFGRASEEDLEALNNLSDSLTELQEDIDHHLERCRDECNPNDILDEQERLERLRRSTKLTEADIDQQLEQSEKLDIGKKKSVLSKVGRSAGKLTLKAGKAAGRTGWRLGKKAFNKTNPINKRVSKGSTSDHGVESLRLANSVYRTGKKTIQTTKQTVQTTKKSIKLAENTAKTTYQTTKKTAVTTYRVTKAIAIFVKDTVIALVTLASFPLFWIIAAIILVIVLVISAVGTLMGGAAAIEEQNREAATDPVALDNVPEDIQDALEFFRIACENQKTEYCDMINGFYYDINNLRESDLVYEVRSNPATIYDQSLATPGRKTTLCNAWNIVLNEPEALAIVYVLLERAENEANGTTLDIYEIEYTQEAFDDLLDVCCVHTDTVFSGQECPDRNCSRHHDEQPNPDYQTAVNNYNYCVSRRDNFNATVVPYADNYSRLLEQYNNAPAVVQAAMQGALNSAWNDLVSAFRSWESAFEWTGWDIDEGIGYNGSAWLQQFVEEAEQTVNNTAPTTSTDYYTCDHQHDLHSVGLNLFNADETMTLYSFSTEERQWAENLIQTYTAYFAYLEAEGGG